VAKAKRKRKLKVYSTPIGFHDAFVAAPSQKAALEAWGASTNLFSQGSAHVVTDPKLAKVPLENPGHVVKVQRGSHAEQLAALAEQKLPKRRSTPEPEILPKKSRKRAAKPGRAALTKGEAALARLNERHSGELERLEKQQVALEEKIGSVRRHHERELDAAQEKLDEERARYREAIRDYESG
jgi:hypothetical protein